MLPSVNLLPTVCQNDVHCPQPPFFKKCSIAGLSTNAAMTFNIVLYFADCMEIKKVKNLLSFDSAHLQF